MLASELSQNWWRPERAAAPASELVPDTDLAFKALVAFTAILLLAPQEWFPVLKSLRIALLAATVSFVAYMFDSAVQRRPVSTFSPEMGICLALVTWSILTIPLSYWPGGSVTELTEHFLKAVAFFWLIGTLVITQQAADGVHVDARAVLDPARGDRRRRTFCPASSSPAAARRCSASPATPGPASRAIRTISR